MVVLDVGLGTLLLGGAAILAVVYKPDRANFERFLHNWVKEQLRKKSEKDSKSRVSKFFSGLRDTAVSGVFTGLSVSRIDDYFFFSVATVVYVNIRYTFVGAYNGWLLANVRRAL